MKTLHQRRGVATASGSTLDVTVSTARDQLQKMFKIPSSSQSAPPSKLIFGRGYKDQHLCNLLTAEQRVSLVPAHWFELNQPWSLFQNENQLRRAFSFTNIKNNDSLSSLGTHGKELSHPSSMNHLLIVASTEPLRWSCQDPDTARLALTPREPTDPTNPRGQRPLTYLGNYYPPPLFPRRASYHLDAFINPTSPKPEFQLRPGEDRVLATVEEYLSLGTPSLSVEPKGIDDSNNIHNSIPQQWQSMILIANSDRLSWGVYQCRLEYSLLLNQQEEPLRHSSFPADSSKNDCCFTDPLHCVVDGQRRQVAQLVTSWLARHDFHPTDYSGFWESLHSTTSTTTFSTPSGRPSGQSSTVEEMKPHDPPIELDSIWYKADADSWTKLWLSKDAKNASLCGIDGDGGKPAAPTETTADTNKNELPLFSAPLPPFPISVADPRLVLIPSHHHFSNASLFRSHQSMDYLLQKFRYGLIRRI